MEDAITNETLAEMTELRQKLRKQQLKMNRLTHEAKTVIYHKDSDVQYIKNTTATMQNVLKLNDLDVTQLQCRMSLPELNKRLY